MLNRKRKSYDEYFILPLEEKSTNFVGKSIITLKTVTKITGLSHVELKLATLGKTNIC